MIDEKDPGEVGTEATHYSKLDPKNLKVRRYFLRKILPPFLNN